jgi:hypothetical protein
MIEKIDQWGFSSLTGYWAPKLPGIS